LHRFRKLASYDTALRIGFKLNKLPEDVYLHAGTQKGSAALKLTGHRSVLGIDQVREKYPEFSRLKPHEIENFLCIYKDKLKPVARYDGSPTWK
jgi:hypothetical protein